MKFTSLAQIQEYVSKSNHTVYARWSASPKKDVGTQMSYNHQTGQPEPGLSANNLRVENVAIGLTEYATSGEQCWLLVGEEVGRGSDNEPCLVNVEMVGTVSNEALAEAFAAVDDTQKATILEFAELYRNRREMYGEESYIRLIAQGAGVWNEDVRKALNING